RNVLTGFMAVDSEPGNKDGEIADDYGNITLLTLPRGSTVPGPGQVQNSFDSDATAANMLNILRRGGSEVISGNLLTLPVGGGMLYVQPVYVQSSGTTQFPLMRRVLVAFGDEIGFAQTLNEALDQVFQGDSGAEAGDANVQPEQDQAPDAGQSGDTGGANATAQQQLNDALARAGDAMEDASAAMSDGDWAAYGEAQDRLKSALQDAQNAEAQITGNAPEGEDSGGDQGAGDGSGG